MDLTLLSCNAAVCIIVNVILSTKFLGEEFIWQYDLTAMLLIAAGFVMIVFKSHTEPVDFTGEDVTDIVISFRMFTYLSVLSLFFVLGRLALRKLLRSLRKFEHDTRAFDARVAAEK